MPELPHSIPEIVESRKNLLKSKAKEIPGVDQLREELYRENPELKLVGAGSSNLVIEYPNNPDKLVAFGLKENPERFPLEHAEVFHIHRILHTIFPENFPKLYASGYVKGEQTIRQKINGQPVGNNDPLDILGNFKSAFGVYNKLNKNAADIGISLDLDIGSPKNFMISDQGKELYVDIVKNRSDDFTLNLEAAEAVIRSRYKDYSENNGAADELVYQVRQSMKRLEQLKQKKQEFVAKSAEK